MPPRNNHDTEKIAVSLPCDLLRRVEKLAKESNMSRSGLVADLAERGLRQTEATRKLLGNRYILRAFQLLFRITPDDCAKEMQETRCDSPATEAVRRTILKEVAKISVAEAEADIIRDIGLEQT